MKKGRKQIYFYFFFWAFLFFCFLNSIKAQPECLKAINTEDMKFNLKFLSSREFLGRYAPSPELDIASKYIALKAEKIGLKPLMADGSFMQKIKAEVNSISAKKSYIEVKRKSGNKRYYFPESFCANMRTFPESSFSGKVVFLGYGLSAPDFSWDDYKNADLKDKIVIILDPKLPKDHKLKPVENRMMHIYRFQKAIERGAKAVLCVIDPERENYLSSKNLPLNSMEFVSFPDVKRQLAHFPLLEIRHEMASDIIGLSGKELKDLFNQLISGKQIDNKIINDLEIKFNIKLDKRIEETSNVVGILEGSDPELINEYVVIGSHHDHLYSGQGIIYPGADDNASGCVAMFEIAKALFKERPKRSIIFIWHTAEEKGLIGAHYFISHSPIPSEKISAMLNIDMISRNDRNSIYLIGSNKISSELDESIKNANEKFTKMTLDYKYEDPKHSERFFFRSDHYPYLTYGIPSVWFFCGTTEDYHQETDIFEKTDLLKMEKVTKLVLLTAIDIANKPELLKLDINPSITKRGIHNTYYDWRK